MDAGTGRKAVIFSGFKDEKSFGVIFRLYS